ncbi:MAG: hypothetical protein H0V76_07650 [Blastocatellia bacterium]|nr:hypothetical protein [Blastocatellia bacterium]
MAKYRKRPFPERLSEINAHYQNWKEKLPIYGMNLGISSSDVARQALTADNFQYLLNYQAVWQDSADAYSAWRREMLYGNPSSQPPLPTLPSLNLPEQHFAGMITEGKRLQQRMFRAPGFNNMIGEDLGLLIANPSPPSPESYVPSLTLKALDGGAVQAKWHKGEFQAIKLEWRRSNEQIWLSAGVFTTSPSIHPADGFVPPAPEARQYRGIMMIKDVTVSEWSPIVSVVTLP